MKPLEEVIPALQLLAIYEDEKKSAANKTKIENALLNHTTTNKQYRREVAQVWATHVTSPSEQYDDASAHRLTDAHLSHAASILREGKRVDEALGDVLMELGSRKLEALTWTQLESPSTMLPNG